MGPRVIGLLVAVAAVVTGVVAVGTDTVATAPISSEGVGKQETGFGDLLTDALLTSSGADIALVAAVSCKPGSIPAGPVTAAQLADLLQNPDESWAMSTLTGAQIVEALEKSLSRLPGTNNAFLQVSGITVTFNPNAKRGSRVASVHVGATPLERSRQYRVVMPLSLAKGGSGYFTVFDSSHIHGDPSEQTVMETLTDFVFGLSKLNYPGTGRLISR
jgi:2',3'-cyclic-nucleotide 2'-phosphodiesterase (5'-nucleotidase family)